MERYIDKDALVAEIEKRRDSLISLSESCPANTAAKSGFYAQAQTLEGIKNFIDTLEVKEAQEESVSEGLEEAAEDYCKSTLVGSPYVKKNAFKEGAKWANARLKEEPINRTPST